MSMHTYLEVGCIKRMLFPAQRAQHLELSKELMMLWSHISLLSVAVTTASAYLLIERREDLLDRYDYVIIGGGLSGLVVANRLTEDLASKW